VFGAAPPINIPYEFFLVEGSKMSSSRGVGASAREMADFLPSEVLRFLMLRTKPNRPVNFSPEEKYIARLFDEFDDFRRKYFAGSQSDPAVAQIYTLSDVSGEGNYELPDFMLLATLAQFAHVDVRAEAEKRKGAPLTTVELRHLDERLHAVRVWLDRYAGEDARIEIKQELPRRAAELDVVERAFLHRLAAALRDASWADAALQGAIFDTARLTPIEPQRAFRAIYRVALDRDSGPRAGSLLAVLDRDFAVRRLSEPPCDTVEFWRATASTPDSVEAWLRERAPQLAALRARTLTAGGEHAVELTAMFADERSQLRRLLLAPDAARSFLERASAAVGRAIQQP
jgi:lysyl-tRNA synthetase class 1